MRSEALWILPAALWIRTYFSTPTAFLPTLQIRSRKVMDENVDDCGKMHRKSTSNKNYISRIYAVDFVSTPCGQTQ
jgi:hypothetical protein